jgi:FMN phosphatase YigB (HAD superfamily)
MTPHTLPFFDVYGTLLRCTPASGAEEKFACAWRQHLGREPGFTLPEWREKIRGLVEVSHARDRAAGVDYPEVSWNSLVTMALGRFGAVSPEFVRAFAAAIMACERTVTAMPGAVELLRFLHERGIPCGIASNAQAYTPGEMTAAGLPLEVFPEDLRVWSWELGFAKPSPCFFQLMATRAARRGLNRSRLLMIGDRTDNDMEPARAAGFQTWHISGPERLSELRERWDELF